MGKLSLLLQPAPPQEPSERHQDQSRHEDAGQQEEEDDAGIGMDRSALQDLERPEADHRDRAARRQDGPDQRDRVLSKKNSRAEPLFPSNHVLGSPFVVFGSFVVLGSADAVEAGSGGSEDASRIRFSSSGCSSSISRSVSLPVIQDMFIGIDVGIEDDEVEVPDEDRQRRQPRLVEVDQCALTS